MSLSLVSSSSSDRIAVLVHGGLDRAYGPEHPLSAWCRDKLNCETFVMTLPLHGLLPMTRAESEIIDPATTPAKQLEIWLDMIITALKPVLARGKPVLIISFSLGALSILAALDSLRSCSSVPISVISVGACLGLTDPLASAIGQFWKLETWKPRFAALQRVHALPKVEGLINFANRFVGSAQSPLFLSRARRLVEYQHHRRIFFINGTDDLPFPPSDAVTAVAEADGASSQWIARHCLAVPCGHFDYFAAGWKAATLPALESILQLLMEVPSSPAIKSKC